MEKFTNRKKLDRMGASLGLWAVLWLGLQYLLLIGTGVDPAAAGNQVLEQISSEQMTWEWVIFLRIMGGLVFLWFMGSMTERFRAAEGDPGRLAYVGFAVGTAWSMVWLLSAFFYSAAVTFSVVYEVPIGARMSWILGHQIVSVLTGPLLFALALTASYIGFRFDGFRSWYNFLTAVVTALLLLLTLGHWYGVGSFTGPTIMVVSLGWIGITSALLVLDISGVGTGQDVS